MGDVKVLTAGALEAAHEVCIEYGDSHDKELFVLIAHAIDAAVQAERERIAAVWVNSPPSRLALTSVQIDKAAAVIGLSDEVDAEWDKIVLSPREDAKPPWPVTASGAYDPIRDAEPTDDP